MRQDQMKAVKVKAGNFCAYQERTQQEVRDKLYKLGLHRDEVEEVLTELITENFVNEERFAKAFASGKFRQKKWGKRKIIYALNQKKISSYCIEQALKEIPDEEYEITLIRLIERKTHEISGNEYFVKNKIAQYLIGKGYETEKVWSIINSTL